MKKLFVFTRTLLLCAAFLLLIIQAADAQNYTLSDTLSGHTGTITAITFNTDGTQLASASDDNTVRIWNAATRQLLHTLTGHQSAVTSVAFSPDGTTLVSGDRDTKTLRFWNPNTGQLTHTWEQFVQAIEDIAWNPDSTRIATAGNFTVRLWNANAHARPDIFRDPTDTITAVAWSPKTGGPVGGGERGTKRMRFWDPATGTLLQTWNQHVQAVEALAFNADGSVLASAGDRTVRLWTPLSHGRPTIFPKTHTDTVTSIAWHPDGDTLVSGSLDTEVILWDTDGNVLDTLSGHTGAVHAVAFSAGGTVASAGADTAIRLWTAGPTGVAHGVQVQGVQAATPPPVVAAAQRAATITDTQLLHYYIPAGDYNNDGQITRSDTLTGPTDYVLCVNFSRSMPLGRGWIVAGDRNGDIFVWSFAGVLRTHIPNAHSLGVEDVIMLSDLSGEIISAGSDGYIKKWNPSTGTVLSTVGRHAGTAFSVAAPASPVYLASGGGDNKVRLWSSLTSTQRYVLTGHTDLVTTVAYKADGTRVASGSHDKTIRLWRNDTGAHIRTLTGHTGPVIDVVFDASDDTYLWSCSHDGTVRKWNTTDGSHTVELRILPGTHRLGYAIEALSLDPSSDGFAVSTVNRALFYTPVVGGYEEDLLPNMRVVWDVAFNPHTSTTPGINLVTAEGTDMTVGLWRRVDADINNDNQVTQADVDLVRSHWGKAIGDLPTLEWGADVDGNGTVDHNDVAHVMAVLYNTPGAPAKQLFPVDTLDTQTALYANYPNPFNPETWIPYQLAQPAEVNLSISAADGRLVRTLALGHQPAGAYLSRSRAGYWDGRNGQGEPVASGVYFYTLKAGDFTATRKMLILK